MAGLAPARVYAKVPATWSRRMEYNSPIRNHGGSESGDDAQLTAVSASAGSLEACSGSALAAPFSRGAW